MKKLTSTSSLLILVAILLLKNSLAAEYHFLKQALRNPEDVTVLKLTLNGVTKKYQNKIFPAAIGKMSNLETIEINTTTFIGFPPEIANCKKLKNIKLIGNFQLPKELALSNVENITWNRSKEKLKVIPEAIFSINSLQSISITNQEITSISENFNKLTNLTYLNLSKNHINHISENFGDLKSLSFLFLNDNNISKISKEMRNLNNLKTLNLNNNQITQLSLFLFELPLLENFSYLENPITVENLNEIADSNIEKYHIYSGVDGEYNTSIKDIVNNPSNIIRLSLYGQNNVVAFLKNAHKFNSLIYLDISGDIVINNEILNLVNIPRLRTFVLTPFNGKIPAKLSEVKQIETLIVDLDYHSRTMPRVIFEMTQLKKLSFLSFNLQAIPENISKLSALESLSINGVFTTIPSSISELTHLKYLQIESEFVNQFTIDISKLKALETIILRTKIEGPLPDDLLKLTQLKKLDLRNNKITDINGISTLLNLEELFLSRNPIEVLTEEVFLIKPLQKLKLDKTPWAKNNPDKLSKLNKQP